MKKIFTLLFPSLVQSFLPFGKSKLTVDGALAQFNNVLADLRKVKQLNDAEEQRQVDAAVAAEELRDEIIQQATEAAEKAIAAANAAEIAASAEAGRAARAIAKIEQFVL